jgi:hypothetical protein
MLLILAACVKEPQDARDLHRQALTLLPQDPDAAALICPQIDAMDLRADCTWAVVETLAPDDAAKGHALCLELPGAFGEECWFLLGETAMDPAACASAGSLADDCRMHVVSNRFMQDFRDAEPGQVEEQAQQVVIWAGLAPRDPRPWSALYRGVLLNRRPLDPSRCDAVSDPELQAICVSTAVPVFHDLLNHNRDTVGGLCTGELPFEVVWTPELHAALDERRGADLCAEDGQRPAPVSP